MLIISAAVFQKVQELWVSSSDTLRNNWPCSENEFAKVFEIQQFFDDL